MKLDNVREARNYYCYHYILQLDHIRAVLLIELLETQTKSVYERNQ
jgi:hypothetical protein